MRQMDIRVLVFYDEVAWVAAGMELYLVSQGKTADEAFRHFEHMLIGSIALIEQFPGHISPLHPESPCQITPQYIQNMWPKNEEGKRYPPSALEYGEYSFTLSRVDI